MDALISYSQTQQQQHLMGSIQPSPVNPEQPMLNNTSSVSPINSLLQHQMYYQSQVAGGSSSATTTTSAAAYNQHFLNQYNMQHQHQQQQQQRADFFKLFSSSNSGSSIPSSASSVCSTGSNHSISSPFLSSSQQSILNPIRFGSSNQLATGNPFFSTEDASYYNPAALLGHLQSKKSYPQKIQHFQPLAQIR